MASLLYERFINWASFCCDSSSTDTDDWSRGLCHKDTKIRYLVAVQQRESKDSCWNGRVTKRSMLSAVEIASLLLVGALWGCSNPYLRKGSVAAAELNENDTIASSNGTQYWLIQQLSKFRYIQVWLPYVLNQTGSILFYITLSRNDLSMTVPVANALALVFSIVTSTWLLNEPVQRPLYTAIGATCIMVGVTICVSASSSHGAASSSA
jgi:Putative transmembrane family 234